MLLHEFPFSSISLVALRRTGTIYQCRRDFFIGSWNTGSQLVHYITLQALQSAPQIDTYMILLYLKNASLNFLIKISVYETHNLTSLPNCP